MGYLEPPADPVKTPKGAVHPQKRDAEMAKEWTDIWTPETLPSVEKAMKFIDEGYPEPYYCEDDAMYVTGKHLLALAKRARSSSAGVDGWTGDLYARLPLPFFELLAKVWNAMMEAPGGFSLPLNWFQVRVTGIPKPGSADLRPISISVLVWRLCRCAVIKNMQTWIQSWVDPDCHGGVKDKQIDSAIDMLLGDLGSLYYSDLLTGDSIDISKFFDSLSISQMLLLASKIGTPPSVRHILDTFLLATADVVCC